METVHSKVFWVGGKKGIFFTYAWKMTDILC